MMKRGGKQEAGTSDHEGRRRAATGPWVSPKDPRVVGVSRGSGGKDRHSKVRTARGLRDRRVRLSVPTAVQLYDLQERLGLGQPSKVVDWLLHAARHEIDRLPPLREDFHFPPVTAPSSDGSHPSHVGFNVDWTTSLLRRPTEASLRRTSQTSLNVDGSAHLHSGVAPNLYSSFSYHPDPSTHVGPSNLGGRLDGHGHDQQDPRPAPAPLDAPPPFLPLLSAGSQPFLGSSGAILPPVFQTNYAAATSSSPCPPHPSLISTMLSPEHQHLHRESPFPGAP